MSALLDSLAASVEHAAPTPRPTMWKPCRVNFRCFPCGINWGANGVQVTPDELWLVGNERRNPDLCPRCKRYGSIIAWTWIPRLGLETRKNRRGSRWFPEG